jgi:hypothetical protein
MKSVIACPVPVPLLLTRCRSNGYCVINICY